MLIYKISITNLASNFWIINNNIILTAALNEQFLARSNGNIFLICYAVVIEWHIATLI
jgi:hypothetical protein